MVVEGGGRGLFMDYQVKLVKGKDGSIAVDSVYAVDYSNKCRQMQDADGDSIPDACGFKTSSTCDEETSFKKIECSEKYETLFKLARDNFRKYFPPLKKANQQKTKKDKTVIWKLVQTRRIMGITSAIYTCGDGCDAELLDLTSDGLVDELLLGIYAYSMRFYGVFPDSAHVRLQQGIVSALEKFLPWEFSLSAFESKVESTEEPGRFRFAHALSFAYDGDAGSNDFMMYDGVKLAFMKEEKAGEGQKILIGDANGKMADVTDDYSEFKTDNLGVVPLASAETDKSQ